MEGASPVSSFKKRTIRPSSSSSSIRSLAASPSTSTLSKETTNDAEQEDEGNVAIVRARGKKTTVGRVKDREGTKKASRLSFGGGAEEDDESDTSFSIQRTESPRRLLRATGLTPSTSTISLPDSTASNGTPARSIYSREYLDQLKATTASTPPPSAASRRGEYDDLTRSKFSSVLDDDMPTSIPTTAAITEAKERRERMRAEGGGTGTDSFISLEVGRVVKSGESRLVREEDELGDGDEDAAEFTGALETVPLGRKANKLAADRMKAGMLEMIEDAEGEEGESDEEAREWEEAQIRRGEQRRVQEVLPIKKAYRAAPIPSTSNLPTLSALTNRFATALSSLQTSNTVDSAALNHFAHERQELEIQEQELRVEVEKAGIKGRWFGDFKIFIEEVAAFLDEKHPLLEKIEKENLSIQKERYDIVFRRRYEDDSDDVSLFTGQSVSAVYRIDDSIPEIEEEEFDELGRTRREFDKGPRSVVRISRRADRDQRTANRLPAPQVVVDDEGSWTDDDLGVSDSQDLASALTSLRESLLALFADVKADDFRDPDLGIRKRFEEWRSKFGEEYANAFGGLALVGVWEFWARVEMALWNPFEIEQLARTAPGLDSYKWHSNLGSFGHPTRATSPAHSEEAMEEDGADESELVVNALVTSVIIPRLEKIAKESYDPLSKKQTLRAIGLIDEVSYCVEKTSPRFEMLIQAFLSRIQLAIIQSQSLIAPHLASIALPSNSFDPSTFAARSRFSYRQSKLLENALKWRRYAKGIKVAHINEGVPPATLDELLTRELVAKVMLPLVEAGWGTGGEIIAAKILRMVPDDIILPALRRRLEGSA